MMKMQIKPAQVKMLDKMLEVLWKFFENYQILWNFFEKLPSFMEVFAVYFQV